MDIEINFCCNELHNNSTIQLYYSTVYPATYFG